jgi:hypothetical protein
MRRTTLLAAAALSLLAGCSQSSDGWHTTDSGGGSRESGPGPGFPDFPHGIDARIEAKVCGEAEFTIARTIPDVLIVLDRSNSMAEGVPPLWDTCRNAIYDITSAMDSQIWFGLFTFPSSLPTSACAGLNNQCTAPNDVVVGVAQGTATAIKGALTNMATCGGTPTAQTLLAAKQYLQAKLAPNGHAKHILLATDGGPNCNPALNALTCTCTAPSCLFNPNNCLDDAQTYKVLDDLCAAGIKTYVIGMGAAQALKNVLDQMAQHGCTGKPYAPTDPAAVKKAFQDIAGAVASCTFEVDCSKIQDSNLVNFYFDGKVVPRAPSHKSGWDWTKPCKGDAGKGTVEFFGPDCDAIKSSTVKKVAAKFGCATKIE